MVYKGVIAGGIGGLAASWIMPKFQFLLSRALGHSDPHEGQGEDATVRTAQRVSSAMLGHGLPAEDEKTAGALVPYVYGTGIGALYGGLAQKHETVTLGFGVGYGAAACALRDETAGVVLGTG